MSTLQIIPGVHQEVPSEQSVLGEPPELMGFLRANQAGTTTCRTGSAPQLGWVRLERRPTSSRTVDG